MTTPYEQTRPPRGTEGFLTTLVSDVHGADDRLVRTLAMQLLPHFLLDVDIEASSEAFTCGRSVGLGAECTPRVLANSRWRQPRWHQRSDMLPLSIVSTAL